MTINIDPVAISVGSLSIRWYGIMIAIGVLVLVLWSYWQIQKKWPEFSSDTVLALAVIGIPSGIIFARLMHIIDRWDYFSHNLDKIIGGQGLTIYGAIIGAILGTWIYSRFKPFNYGRFVDILAPGVVLGQAIGRVGCLINGCCYGTATSLPWAISYIHPNSVNVSGVHPTHIYEILFMLLLFGVLMLLDGRLKPDGSLFMVYIGSYSLWRLGLGFLRPGTDFLFGLHQAQIIGIVILIIVVAMAVYRKVHWVKTKETPTQEN